MFFIFHFNRSFTANVQLNVASNFIRDFKSKSLDLTLEFYFVEELSSNGKILPAEWMNEIFRRISEFIFI